MSEGRVVHVLSGQPYDVYVGRANPRHDLARSEWANPLKIGEHGTREEVLARYEGALRQACEDQPESCEGLASLHGKILACWCAPKDGHLTTDDETVCHGQVLLRLADELAEGA